MNIRKITILGLYTSIALIVFTIEASLPGLAPIPGIKLGLANIVTLYVISNHTIKDAFFVLIMRIVLAALLVGQGVSFLYSLIGGIFCFIVMVFVHKLVGGRYLYLTSIMGAIAHNIGQIGVAFFIIKLSGEALAGEKGFGLDESVIEYVVKQIKQVVDSGVEVGIIIGGGNFWRGRQGSNMDRTTADHMGMLATVINSLAMQDALERNGIATRVQTALTITRVAEPYILRKAMRHFEKGRVVIFACGTGNPYFSTDTGAALRAAEIGAEALLLAKNVDGIYDSDPKKNPNAKKFDEITYIDVIKKGLNAMDTTAISLCMENKIPVIAFALSEENSIIKAVKGETIGTIIK